MVFISLLFRYTFTSLSVPEVLIPPEAYNAFKTVAMPLTKCGPGVLTFPKTATLTGLIWVRETSKNVLDGFDNKPL